MSIISNRIVEFTAFRAKMDDLFGLTPWGVQGVSLCWARMLSLGTRGMREAVSLVGVVAFLYPQIGPLMIAANFGFTLLERHFRSDPDSVDKEIAKLQEVYQRLARHEREQERGVEEVKAKSELAKSQGEQCLGLIDQQLRVLAEGREREKLYVIRFTSLRQRVQDLLDQSNAALQIQLNRVRESATSLERLKDIFLKMKESAGEKGTGAMSQLETCISESGRARSSSLAVQEGFYGLLDLGAALQAVFIEIHKLQEQRLAVHISERGLLEKMVQDQRSLLMTQGQKLERVATITLEMSERVQKANHLLRESEKSLETLRVGMNAFYLLTGTVLSVAVGALLRQLGSRIAFSVAVSAIGVSLLVVQFFRAQFIGRRIT